MSIGVSKVKLLPKHWRLCSQQPRGNSLGIHLVKPFHTVYLFFSISYSYPSRRPIASINTPVLISKRRLLIVEIQNLFVQLYANKPLRVISTPLLLWFSSRDYKSGGFIAPNWCSYSLQGTPWLIVSCVGWFFESVVGRILDLGCRLKTVVSFEFYLLGCTSYRCLQQAILASLKLVIWYSSNVVKVGTPWHIT
jgi:hypothetical protein